MSTEEELDEYRQRLAESVARKEREQASIVDHQERLLYANIWRSCLNCINWSEKPNLGCRIYKALPPPKVIVHGCRDWDDDIPF